MKNRYVITGIGQISPMGNSIEEMRQNFVHNYQSFHLTDSGSVSCVTAKVSNFDFYQYGFNIKTYIDRASQLCTYAVGQVVRNLGKGCIENHRKGLVTSSCFGCLDSASNYLHQLKTLKKAKFASPLFFTHSICNIPNSIASIEFELRGISNHLVGSSDSGLMTLWQGIQNIETDQVDYVITGGFDALSEELIANLSKFRLLNKDTGEDTIKGPFDKGRKYAVWGEAAAFLSIEKRETAIKRGGKVFGEIKGIGIATSYKNKVESIKQAMRIAIERSCVDIQDIAFVLSNANGTLSNDSREASAVKDVLGIKVPVFAPKSYFGEVSAASGVLGIVLVLCIKNGKLPQNRCIYNVEDNRYINVMYDNVTIKAGDVFIVNGFNRGGTSVSVCIEVCEGV